MTYIFDLDGTICFDGKTISNDITDAINELISLGNQVIFATARPIRDALHLLESFGEPLIIGANGAITNVYGKISSKTISVDIVKELYGIYQSKFSDANILIDYDFNYYYHGNKDCHLLERIDTMKIAKNLGEVCFDNVIKLAFIENGNVIDSKLFYQYCDALEYTFYPSESIHEFVVLNVNKYTVIDEYLKGQAYTFFGNDFNDILALENAELGFIVGDQINIDGVRNIKPSEIVEVIRNC